MAADHGDGGSQQGIGRLQADELADTDADAVLEDGNDTCDQPVDDEQQAALLQQLEAGAQTDGGEECQHEGTLEVGVEVERKGVGHMTDEGDEHEQEAAHNRCGNAVLVQNLDLALDEEADQQQNGSHGGSHDRISVEIQHAFEHFNRHVSSSSLFSLRFDSPQTVCYACRHSLPLCRKIVLDVSLAHSTTETSNKRLILCFFHKIFHHSDMNRLFLL